jgi:hypothetical protein
MVKYRFEEILRSKQPLDHLGYSKPNEIARQSISFLRLFDEEKEKQPTSQYHLQKPLFYIY